MLHQISMFSDKVKLAADKENYTLHPPTLPHPLPSHLDKRIVQEISSILATSNFPLPIYPCILYPLFLDQAI